MNLPNKLTVMRAIAVPFFVVLMLIPVNGAACEGWCKWTALAVFIIAALTDLLDGKIARKYQLITNFGKFMDPLADKLLVCSALICLVELERIPAWVVIVIIAREFVISGIRLVAADDGVVIAASKWGKFKTVFQMIMVGFMIGNLPVFDILTQILMWIALALTLISMVDYIIKNINVFKKL
ncbi:MAG: CDP-diacylglycerol--glycerol-3-phosphate 3-phosphatidyltransferase [Lachnospiraceae bacterium]|nr:CDP-diacylglycerol--glycerol-3-phosphate 3-phosphatidyltransferase [Lachnospiraceae bacterium]